MYFFFFLAVLGAGADAALAPFITACHAADSKCMRESAQAAVPVLAAGLPALGLNSLDPLHIERVSADQAGLNMDFRDTTVKGLRHCKVLDNRRRGNKVSLSIQCSAQLSGDYTLGGRLLVLPIEGDGKYRIRIRDILVKIEFDVDTKEAEGAKHWSVKRWHHTAEVLTGVDFHFQNLFRGNKQLSDAVHQFANSNWRDIFHEVAPPIVKAVVAAIVAESNKFFSKVPLSELTLD